MDFEPAAIALRSFAVTGKTTQAETIVRFLASLEGIAGRWTLDDLRGEAAQAASQLAGILPPGAPPILFREAGPPTVDDDTRNALESLVSQLERSSPCAVVAIFDEPTSLRESWGDAIRIGQLGWVAGNLAVSGEANASPAALTLGVFGERCGPSAAALGLEHLRMVVGALYVAALTGGVALEPPTDRNALQAGIYASDGGDGARSLAPRVAAGSALNPAELDALLLGEEAQLFLALAAHPAASFLAKRCARALPWVQRGVDAISFADAVLSFGVALESVVGDEEAATGVVETVSRRCGFLLVPERDPMRRLDRMNETKSFYDWRSRVAHGQFESANHEQNELAQVRSRFTRFVVDVITAFAQRAQAEDWADARAFKAWYDLALVA